MIKEKFALNQKQFKNLSALGEKQNIFKRITTRIDVNNSTNIDEMSGDMDENDDEENEEDDDRPPPLVSSSSETESESDDEVHVAPIKNFIDFNIF